LLCLTWMKHINDFSINCWDQKCRHTVIAICGMKT
jgi:hypothetical protein